ncbi:LysM peptidoglycan-binding domain-containing protein [Nocardioides halotolerans]|jgi:nucleoid-associated protein YgaU|uniref:LysM peptidoglycan-binding domain-containing protein n=1 Tax=Nocardioides halotolerans TaxID=433660 RepID=UPI00040A6A84|nr:LysM domain-containing protein [Nocardioides halotolerans]
MNVVAASRPRCLAVATGLTAALWGAAAVLVRMLAAGQPATAGATPDAGPDAGLVRLCLGALVLAVGWAWLQAMAGVGDAWRGARCAPGHGVRRLVVVACGVALAGSLGGPALAGHGDPPPDPLSGLPLPQRAEGPGHPRGHSVVVRPGDTLWSLAERRLPEPASARQVTAGWHAIYRRNRGVIGPDPDLIRPGQVLVLTRETT